MAGMAGRWSYGVKQPAKKIKSAKVKAVGPTSRELEQQTKPTSYGSRRTGDNWIG